MFETVKAFTIKLIAAVNKVKKCNCLDQCVTTFFWGTLTNLGRHLGAPLDGQIGINHVILYICSTPDPLKLPRLGITGIDNIIYIWIIFS